MITESSNRARLVAKRHGRFVIRKIEIILVAQITFKGNSTSLSGWGNFTQFGKLYYHNDHLGSTSVITNQSGSVVEQTFYEPFGGIIAGGNTSRYDYEGREFSELTQDYDFRFRKYDPELKIFTQGDAGVNDVYDPQDLNRYAFERNNPYKYVDPNGKVFFLAPVILVFGSVLGLSLLYSYGLEIYHGFREGANPQGTYGAGALRAGQDLGSPLFDSDSLGEFSLNFLPFGLSDVVDAVNILEEILSGRKSKFIGQSSFSQTDRYPFSSGSFGFSTFNSNNQFASGFSYQLDQTQTNQIIDYGNGVSYNSGTGVVCTGELCYSTAFPDSYSGSSGSNNKSGGNSNEEDKPSEDYCATHSDGRC